MKNILLALFFIPFLFTNNKPIKQNTSKKILSETAWVDSVFLTLNTSQKIGQLLMVRANNAREPYSPEINHYIDKYGIGGVCFFGSGPVRQAKQTNLWQKRSRVPLLTAIDGEWGLGMRLDSTISFPYQMTLGSIEDNTFIFEMGKQIGEQCSRIGLHMNFAPVVDVNVNPKNPVINSRSFGDNPKNVSEKAIAYQKGLQSKNIIASAKHFPGHGDTDRDSHFTLPLIKHDLKRLDSIELMPFKEMIKSDLQSIMVAHLYIPALEKEENLASTLSPKIINGLLRDSLNFDGLVITDALDMEGVTKYFNPGEIEVRALLAGNDVLLLPKDVPRAVSAILEALETGRIDTNYFEEKVKKVLKYKYRAGLYKKPYIEIKNLTADLNTPKALALNQQLYEEASILLKNNTAVLPFQTQLKKKTAVLTLGLESKNIFLESIQRFASLNSFYLPKSFSQSQARIIEAQLNDYEQIIIGLGGISIFPNRNFGITKECIELISNLSKKHTVILSFFGSPLAYNELLSVDGLITASIIAHQDNEYAARSVAQQLFGALPFKGKLPVGLNENYPSAHGINTNKTKRLGFGFPEQVGIDTKKLEYIDSLVKEGIDKQAFPGCQVVVARNGRMIYSKSFGYQTYSKKKAIDNYSIYDLASITKVAATTPSLMKLQAEQKFDPEEKISTYLPALKFTNKASIKNKELLTHQSAIATWIPFYLKELDKSNLLNPLLFSTQIDEKHSNRVAQNLYIDKNYAFKIYDTIANSALRKKNGYAYSDLGFYWFKQYIELQTNTSLDRYVQRSFYNPMGLRYIGFLPRQRFEEDQLVPTEMDTIFRKQLIQGDVHDPGAAMLGGVSGHAGLFSNAEDLAAVFQLFLQNGNYAGYQLLDSAIISQYTAYQYNYKEVENRRGLGFDKPYPVYDSLGPVCKSASPLTYGHTGFTGTAAWVDPKYDLVFIFLSNRVYPDANNTKISKFNFRTRIQQAIYDAIQK